MTNYNIRWASRQVSVKLPDGSTVLQVIDAARNAGLPIPTDLSTVLTQGYATGHGLDLSAPAPTDEVIIVNNRG